MTTEQDKMQQRLRPAVLATMEATPPYEMAKGFLRYEALKVRDRGNMDPELFDLMADNLIVANYDPVEDYHHD